MILGGYRPDELGTVTLTLTLDSSNFERALVDVARRTIALGVTQEVWRLNPDQVRARFFVRGGMDPEFTDTPAGRDRRDHYLRALMLVPGVRGAAARDGFLAGWAACRTTEPVESFAWHRYLDGTELRVSAA